MLSICLDPIRGIQDILSICKGFIRGRPDILNICSLRYPCRALVSPLPSCNPTWIKCVQPTTRTIHPSVCNNHQCKNCRSQCILTVSGKGWLNRVYTFACLRGATSMQVRRIAPATTPFPNSEQVSFRYLKLINHIMLAARSLINHIPQMSSLIV